MPRVLITGAAGFIGMHTCIRFLKDGWDVVGLDNMNDYYSVNLKKDRLREIQNHSFSGSFTMHRKDLNSNIWESLSMLRFDAVVHLAAQAGVRYSLENPRAYLESNILGFHNVMEFVSKNKIQKFIYASSSSVYGKSVQQPFTETQDCSFPESYYAATKKSNELMAQSYYKTMGVSSLGLRFFTVYGPWGRPDMAPMLFTKAAFKNQSVSVFNHGNQKRDFTYVGDIVEGLIRLISVIDIINGAEICNIGNGSPIHLLDFIKEIESLTGRFLTKRFVQAQKGDVEITYANTKKLEELSGYSPKVSLKEGMTEFINWYKDYYNV